MQKLSCPSCGAEVVFQSSASVFSVCKYCQSTLIRKDLNLEVLGKMADLKEDMTPLQIGTTGKYKGEFVLIGRLRVTWSDGFWNEWFVRFDDGREAWLAEAQGFYMISFQVETPAKMPAAADLSPGAALQLGNIEFKVDDVKRVTYSFAEGELPFAAPQGLHAVSVDLRHGESDFASVSFAKAAAAECFVGQYLEFDRFHFQNLREIDGW